MIDTVNADMMRIQNEIKKKIICEDSFVKEDLKTVAGVDLAYWMQENQEYAVCCIVILDYQTGDILEKKQFSDRITVAYQPGFLAFRELPLVLQTVEKLEIKPDLYLFDGNGYLHPRHAGIASHAGVVLDTPAIGIAKSYYKISDVDYTEPENTAGSYTDIVISQEVYGRVLRTQEHVKPVFLSVGHAVSLETATEIAMHFVTKESHIPMPTRLADLETHSARKAILKL